MQTKGLYNYQNQLVIAIALLATFLPLMIIEYSLMQYTGGVFMYPLDDTFIHMELAKNLANHQTWGINPGEFGSASSSLLYTVLLALLIKVFSNSILIPFIVNCVAAVVLILVVQKWMNRKQIGLFAQIIILLVIVFLVPLPILVMSGMEHVLQALFSFLFLSVFSDWIEDTKKERGQLPFRLMLYGVLVCAIRYEGIFLVGAACLVALGFKKYRQALLLGSISVSPLLLFGLYALGKGGGFIPNSVLVKSGIPFSLTALPAFISGVLVDKLTLSKTITALATQRLLIILPIAYFLFFGKRRKNFSSLASLLVLAICTLLHLSFASTGWFYRYEAYLILCSIIVISFLIVHYGKEIFTGFNWTERLFLFIAVFFLFFPFILRSAAAFSKARQACINIYEQQYQMGQFMNEYYPKATFAANDIGAVSYFTSGRLIDLWGLATNEIAKSKKEHYWTAGFLDSFSRANHAKLAIVYDNWFDSSLLKRWTKVGEWKIRNNVICGDDRVSFYAVDATFAEEMKNNLKTYQKKLPSSVEAKYY